MRVGTHEHGGVLHKQGTYGGGRAGEAFYNSKRLCIAAQFVCTA